MRGYRPILLWAVLIVSVVALFAQREPSRAHPLQEAGLLTQLYCLNPGQTNSFTLASAQGPTHRSWAIHVRIGLQNGSPDTAQDSYFTFLMKDNATGAEVATYSALAREWIATSHVFGSTLTGHVGGTLKLLLILSNPDPVSQCYDVYARFLYETF